MGEACVDGEAHYSKSADQDSSGERLTADVDHQGDVNAGLDADVCL